MRISKETLETVRMAADLVKSDVSAVWLEAAASALQMAADKIRAEVAAGKAAEGKAAAR